MAPKALLFLLAFVLLVCNQVTSTEEETLTEKHHHHDYAKAPAHAPEHSPKKERAYHHKHGQCVEMCFGPKGYCQRMRHQKRECERACVRCCDQYKCVPEPNKKCTWDKVWHDNQWVKCP